MKTILLPLLLAPTFAFAGTYKCDVTLGSNDETTTPLKGLAVAEAADYNNEAQATAIPGTKFTVNAQIYATGAMQAVNVIIAEEGTNDEGTISFASQHLGDSFAIAGMGIRGQDLVLNCSK